MTEVFDAKLRRIGNSLGVIIPANVIEHMGFHRGDMVKIAIPSASNGNDDVLRKLAGTYRGTKPFRRSKVDRY